MDITTDIPTNYHTLNPNFEFNNEIEKLQTMLNEKNIDIDSLDNRGTSNNFFISPDGKTRELKEMIKDVNLNSEQQITTKQTYDLNDIFIKNLRSLNVQYMFPIDSNMDPSFILQGDIKTRNNIDLIRTSNNSYQKERDKFTIQPSRDIQQKIFELLNTTK